MGNVVTQSCCHAHAKLHVIDKMVNILLGCFLPLEKACTGKTEEARLELLSECRRAHTKMSSSYSANVQGIWKPEERALPRRHGDGGPVQVCLHTPLQRAAGEDVPLIVWAHGGCMTLGDRHDAWGSSFMKELAAKIGPFCWASVEYRLAPESKFPSFADDFASAYVSLMDATLAQEFGYSTERVSIMGVSAGALVVAHAALRLDAKYKPSMALLYPMVDPEMRSKSHALYGRLPACPSRFLRLSWDWLLSEEGQVSARRLDEANLLTSDWRPLSGRKAFVLLARYDCLHDEGQALAQHCTQAGLRVTTVESQGSHAVANMVDKKSQVQIFESVSKLLR
ncbi:lipN [Symbiodinium natans]|uniref:LipN protein n=1 Tax=Symbiodinium natans TaxID=878477 RepID=A0A812P5F0_9DINO|nr:lipN [Symbiodinium natans]